MNDPTRFNPVGDQLNDRSCELRDNATEIATLLSTTLPPYMRPGKECEGANRCDYPNFDESCPGEFRVDQQLPVALLIDCHNECEHELAVLEVLEGWTRAIRERVKARETAARSRRASAA